MNNIMPITQLSDGASQFVKDAKLMMKSNKLSEIKLLESNVGIVVQFNKGTSLEFRGVNTEVKSIYYNLIGN